MGAGWLLEAACTDRSGCTHAKRLPPHGKPPNRLLRRPPPPRRSRPAAPAPLRGRVSQLTHHWTYHDVVGAEYGKPGLLALKVAIIINNAGSMVRPGAGWVAGLVAAGSPLPLQLPPVLHQGRTAAAPLLAAAAVFALQLGWRMGALNLPANPAKPAPHHWPNLQIVYLIIIGDVLVGIPPEYNGLITNLLGVHDPHGAPLAGCWGGRGCRRSPQQHLPSPPARACPCA